MWMYSVAWGDILGEFLTSSLLGSVLLTFQWTEFPNISFCMWGKKTSWKFYCVVILFGKFKPVCWKGDCCSWWTSYSPFSLTIFVDLVEDLLSPLVGPVGYATLYDTLLPQTKRWRDLGVLPVSVTLCCDQTNLIWYKWPKCISCIWFSKVNWRNSQELICKLLLVHSERTQLRWLRHVIRMTSRFPAAAFLEHPTRSKPKDYSSTSWDFPGAGRCGKRKGYLGLVA